MVCQSVIPEVVIFSLPEVKSRDLNRKKTSDKTLKCQGNEGKVKDMKTIDLPREGSTKVHTHNESIRRGHQLPDGLPYGAIDRLGRRGRRVIGEVVPAVLVPPTRRRADGQTDIAHRARVRVCTSLTSGVLLMLSLPMWTA